MQQLFCADDKLMPAGTRQQYKAVVAAGLPVLPHLVEWNHHTHIEDEAHQQENKKLVDKVTISKLTVVDCKVQFCELRPLKYGSY